MFPCRRDGLDAFLKIKPVAADALDAERDRVDVVPYLRERIGVVRYLRTWRDEHTGFLDSCRDDAVGQVWRELGEEIGRLPTEPAGYGAAHNDLHAGNLLMTDEGDLTVLDFDACTRHWYATDLAILPVHPIWDLRRQDPAAIGPFVDTAPESYPAALPLDPGHLAHTPLLMRYRMALFVPAMAGELGDTPRPPWPAEIRTWVLSGEPVADIRIG